MTASPGQAVGIGVAMVAIGGGLTTWFRARRPQLGRFYVNAVQIGWLVVAALGLVVLVAGLVRMA
jgi:hypothetical protein